MAARILNWKIILLFCMGIACGLAFIALFIPADPDVPTLPDELLIQAQAMRENAQTESRWQDKLASTGNVDAQLAAILNDALADGDYRTACGAASRMKDKTLADRLLTAIIKQACSRCETLPWGALALSDMSGEKEELTRELHKRWRECRPMQ